jgi:hypothetical protein
LAEWLNAYYWRTEPLVNILTENDAPTPTHFSVAYGDRVTEWAMSQWDQNLNITETLITPSTAVIRFFKRTSQGDQHLSFAAVPIKTVL